jgi:RimJ/RimL family protein N-acetyltransferase
MEGIYLRTPRLVLKPHTLDNAEKVNAWDNDPEIRYYSDDNPEDRARDSIEDTRHRLECMSHAPADGHIIHYAIHRRESQDLIGFGMIACVDPHNRRCKLGIVVGDKSQWGRGLGREALTAVIEHCFSALGMNRIGAEVYAINGRSVRLFEGLGFRREGVIRQVVLKRGRFEDEYVYGLLAQEWRARHMRVGTQGWGMSGVEHFAAERAG